MRLVTIWVTCVPVETAATLSALQNLPMTKRSTAPYSDWSILAMRNGSAKRNSVDATGPSERSRAFMEKGDHSAWGSVNNPPAPVRKIVRMVVECYPCRNRKDSVRSPLQATEGNRTPFLCLGSIGNNHYTTVAFVGSILAFPVIRKLFSERFK